jgi:hypothetical protein
MIYEIAGLVAGILAFVAYVIYAATTLGFGQQTKPNRATWWILTLVGTVLAESYYSSGADASIWIAVSYVIGPLLIAIISLPKKFGVGGWDSSFDRRCLQIAFVAAIISIIIRKLYPEYANISLLINIGIDFIGILPTVIKAYKNPEHEDKIAWGFTFLACPLALFAVNSTDFFLWIYPLYLLVMNGLIFAFVAINKPVRRLLGQK